MCGKFFLAGKSCFPLDFKNMTNKLTDKSIWKTFANFSDNFSVKEQKFLFDAIWQFEIVWFVWLNTMLLKFKYWYPTWKGL